MTVSDTVPDTAAVSIRRARQEDAAAVAELCCQLGYAATEADIGKRLSMIQRNENQAVFVACAGYDLIGWIDVAITLHLQSQPFALIGGLVVKDGHRGKGVGQRLCDAAEEWAGQQGVSVMRVTSRSTRVDAHRFYLRDGYTDVKTSRVFEKALKDRPPYHIEPVITRR
jgi:GNAT superfamily N-acetyltransferase